MAVIHVLFVAALLPLLAVIQFISKAVNFTNMRHSCSQKLLLIGESSFNMTRGEGGGGGGLKIMKLEA